MELYLSAFARLSSINWDTGAASPGALTVEGVDRMLPLAGWVSDESSRIIVFVYYCTEYCERL